jgi:lipopolysaccharide/colanic/teichoic acid biosynthesis glycosyltransferase
VKRAFDCVAAAIGLTIGAIVLIPAAVLVWAQDGHSPWYIAPRAGRGGKPFRMVKLRSMRILADTSGVLSTAGNDPRITRIGKLIRRLKIDELPQLWNVLRGEMSLVGPRPQVLRDVEKYTARERDMLTTPPGITDLASIVFADEGEILRGAPDPDARYDEIIRPWKSRLALLYVDGRPSVVTDIRIVLATIQNAISRPAALATASRLARALGADETLRRVALRCDPLRAAPPPGAESSERSDKTAAPHA